MCQVTFAQGSANLRITCSPDLGEGVVRTYGPTNTARKSFAQCHSQATSDEELGNDSRVVKKNDGGTERVRGTINTGSVALPLSLPRVPFFAQVTLISRRYHQLQLILSYNSRGNSISTSRCYIATSTRLPVSQHHHNPQNQNQDVFRHHLLPPRQILLPRGNHSRSAPSPPPSSPV